MAPPHLLTHTVQKHDSVCMCHRKMEVDEEGNKYVVFGSGNSSDLGKAAEDALIRWVEELYVRGWPPEWGDIHAAAKSIARSQGEH